MHRRHHSIRFYIFASFALAGIALASALMAEYVYNLEPCHLCIYQRIPYAFILLAGPLGWVFCGNRKISFTVLKLITFLFLISALLGLYHVGVEQHWWQSAAGCEAPAARTIEELRARLYAQETVPCDKIAWSFLGLSMATYNTMLSFFMGLLGTLVWIKEYRYGHKKTD